jgi:hypothetical protein
MMGEGGKEGRRKKRERERRHTCSEHVSKVFRVRSIQKAIGEVFGSQAIVIGESFEVRLVTLVGLDDTAHHVCHHSPHIQGHLASGPSGRARGEKGQILGPEHFFRGGDVPLADI